jgi:NhaP-type Na+/H+ or K+/H+ antiporter
VFPSLDILEMALLATMLAPTDAALGKPVVTNQAVPVLAAGWTVLLSVIAHGVSANPLVSAIGRRVSAPS